MSAPSAEPSVSDRPSPAAVQCPPDAIVEEPRQNPLAEPSGSEVSFPAAVQRSPDAIVEEPRERRSRDSIVYVVRQSFHQTLPGDINHAISTITGTPVSNNFSVHDSNDRSTSDENLPSSDPEKGRHNPAWTRYPRRAMSHLTMACRATSLVIIATTVAIICLLPDGLFAAYAYYFSYADIFFNSRTAVSIYNNHRAESVFKLFFWVISGIASIPHALIGFGLASLCYRTRKHTKMRYHIFVLWMTPPILFCLLLTSVSFWIRPVVRDAYQAHVFDHMCRAKEWDLDVVLTTSASAALNLSLSLVGNASISSNLFPGVKRDAQLIRHFDNFHRFDFVPLQPDDTLFPFTNVTFDWKDQTYSAISSSQIAVNLTGTFTTTPELTFPSLHLSSYDPEIPFVQPASYRACWPAAATLILRNSSSSYQYNVLRTLTHKPRNRMQMKLCAMTGSEIARELQISLGVVFINHFYYSTCVANGGAVSGEL